MIETDRLLFRPYTMDDLDFYASLWANQDVIRYIGMGKPKSYEEAEEHMRNRILPEYEQGLGLYAMVYQPDNRLIGHAGLIRQTIDGQEEVEIGYWLVPEYWGQGLAKEAAVGFRDYGLNDLKLNQLISIINPNHPASIFVAKKAGLFYDKTVRLHVGDALIYRVTSTEN
ncbi:GNAT family N-acetyltransferase [Tuberibacillus sp. Marseille-P3662]|uniref:GNAT family N-acetyltransferase n=1 Tax=Tuberibacillus sp. Marseille-P3662 TaxID=1965358 RepID=UPI000A1C87BD|nr:GNAT family N-acetyltransferase [Tuberibacillus sp. Marseille-P3662]